MYCGVCMRATGTPTHRPAHVLQPDPQQLCPACSPGGHVASLAEDGVLARYAYCLGPLVTYLKQPGTALPPAGFSLLHSCKVEVMPCTAEACNGGIRSMPLCCMLERCRPDCSNNTAWQDDPVYVAALLQAAGTCLCRNTANGAPTGDAGQAGAITSTVDAVLISLDCRAGGDCKAGSGGISATWVNKPLMQRGTIVAQCCLAPTFHPPCKLAGGLLTYQGRRRRA